TERYGECFNFQCWTMFCLSSTEQRVSPHWTWPMVIIIVCWIMSPTVSRLSGLRSVASNGCDFLLVLKSRVRYSRSGCWRLSVTSGAAYALLITPSFEALVIA